MTSHEAFFTVKHEPEEPAPAITYRAAAVQIPGLAVHLLVHSGRQRAADELFDCLQEAVKKTCEYCLEGNMLDPSHAGEHCPFSPKEPCMVQKWKEALYHAGKEPMNYYVKLKKLNRRK